MESLRTSPQVPFNRPCAPTSRSKDDPFLHGQDRGFLLPGRKTELSYERRVSTIVKLPALEGGAFGARAGQERSQVLPVSAIFQNLASLLQYK
jgi:hypothetical protein